MALGILENPKNVYFDDLVNLCTKYFGQPRIKGSHYIFKMPWPGNPRINLQKDDHMAKPYQVRDVKKAICKFEEEDYGKSN